MKHIKGPWYLGNPEPIGIVGGKRVLVSLFAGDETESRGPTRLGDLIDNEDLANARLIAVAPELLETAKAYLILLEGVQVNPKLEDLRKRFFAHGILSSLTQSIRRKIAKAEGNED